MDCKFDTSLLQDYLDGSIDKLEKIFVEEHLKVCSECRKDLSILKLLLWDLNSLSSTEIEVPLEAEAVRGKALDTIFGAENKKGIKGFLNIQKNTAMLSTSFLNYIPLANESKILVKKGLAHVPSSMRKVSGSIFKGCTKVMQARFQP